VDNAASDRASETKKGCRPSTPTSKNGLLKTGVIVVDAAHSYKGAGYMFVGWKKRDIVACFWPHKLS
jgi:hypothetical protein